MTMSMTPRGTRMNAVHHRVRPTAIATTPPMNQRHVIAQSLTSCELPGVKEVRQQD
jgi:hypothetical protein